MRSMRSLLPLWIVVSVAVAPRVASANALFPSAVQAHLGLSYTPPCIICHKDNNGGRGTVVKPFGIAMRAANLTDPDPSTVGPALDTLKAEQVDSDCNGILDGQQLIDGRDPNPPGEFINGSTKKAPADPGCMDMEIPEFGCGAQLAPVAPNGDGAGALAATLMTALLGLSLARRRRP